MNERKSPRSPKRDLVEDRGHESFFRARPTTAVLFVLILLFLATWVGLTLRRHRPLSSETPITVTVYTVQRKQAQIPVIGTVYGGAMIPLRFKTAGVLKELRFKEGDQIHRGDVIGTLDSTNSLLAAPHDGILEDVRISIGQNIAPLDRIATLVTTSTMSVRFPIPEICLDSLSIGQNVSFTVDAFPGGQWNGVLESVGPGLREQGQDLACYVMVPNNDKRLRPGMTARTAWMSSERDGVVAIPADAVEMIPGNPRVFIVRNERAEAQFIDVERMSETFALIKKGLAPGDLVISPRPPQLTPGVRVRLNSGKLNRSPPSPPDPRRP